MKNLSDEEQERLEQNNQDAKISYILVMPILFIFFVSIVIAVISLST